MQPSVGQAQGPAGSVAIHTVMALHTPDLQVGAARDRVAGPDGMTTLTHDHVDPMMPPTRIKPMESR